MVDNEKSEGVGGKSDEKLVSGESKNKYKTRFFAWSGSRRFDMYVNYGWFMGLIRVGRIIRSDVEDLLDYYLYRHINDHDRLRMNDINILFDQKSDRNSVIDVLDKLASRGKYGYQKIPYICSIPVYNLVWLIEVVWIYYSFSLFFLEQR